MDLNIILVMVTIFLCSGQVKGQDSEKIPCGFNAVATATNQPITSPGYPNNYPNNVNCTWTINSLDGMNIHVILHTFDTERNSDYLTIFNYTTQMAKLSGSHSQSEYYSTGNTLTLRFNSNGSGARSGFYATYTHVRSFHRPICGFGAVATTTSQPIISPGYPNIYPNNVHCFWFITAPYGMLLQLHLISVQTDIYDEINLKVTFENKTLELHFTRLPTVYKPLGNSMRLTFLSDRSAKTGFNVTYSAYRPFDQFWCPVVNLNATTTNQRITSPGYPNNYPNNVYCIWTITAPDGMRVQLRIEHLVTEPNFDYLRILSRNFELESLNGSQTNKEITSVDHTLTLRFYSDNSITFNGFNAKFKGVVHPGYTSRKTNNAILTRQYITSPGYPNNYPNGKGNSWRITAPDGMRVQFNLHELNTEKNIDLLSIQSRSRILRTVTIWLLARLSGSESNKMYKSISNSFVYFKTDRSIAMSGFNASYFAFMDTTTTAVKPLKICEFNAVATATNQPITSPGYPNNYPNNVNCTWTITAPDGMRVQLNLQSLDTEVYFDYLQVVGPRLGWRSGSQSDRMILSREILSLYVSFQINLIQCLGLTQHFAVATTTSQPITSPGYPNNYPSDVNCTWTITAPDGMRVQLNLQTLDTEAYFDYLTLLSDIRSFARFSGAYANKTYTSFDNSLTLRFTSDRSITRSGFIATFTGKPTDLI
ncbi:cubilin-like [Ciona intestinalis]